MNRITVKSPKGKYVSLRLSNGPDIISDYSRVTIDSPRQVTEAYVDIREDDGKDMSFNSYWGTATHNPWDIYDQEKAYRIAISHAIGELDRETRTDIWAAVHEILDIEATAKALITLDLMFKKYGQRLTEMLDLPNNEHAKDKLKELAS
jgi:hypothetical protein